MQLPHSKNIYCSITITRKCAVLLQLMQDKLVLLGTPVRFLFALSFYNMFSNLERKHKVKDNVYAT